LCSILQPPATSSLLGPDIPLSNLFPHIFNQWLHLLWETKFHTNTKHPVIYSCVCFREEMGRWFWTEWQQAFPEYICSEFLSERSINSLLLITNI
jgi:hypothetical protein